MAEVNGRTIRLAIGAFALALGGPAAADVRAGVEAWSRGQYEAAVREWRGPAERGDADALFNLAQAHKLGRGVPMDLAKAEDLFGKAAAKGHLQASDNYGLLLFQRGERQRALPYIQRAAERGDARAQYLLGIAHFNGDGVAKDWPRAYALVTLAQQANLPQAAPALQQMDNYIPLDQRQQSVPLAARLRDEARAARSRQLAAADLGATVATPGDAAAPASHAPEIVSAENAVAAAARAAGTDSPRTAGADYARPQTPAPASRPATAAASAPAARTPPVTKSPPAAAPSSESGAWRVQLGAFGVAANAQALWNRVKDRPELTGHGKLLVPAGRITKLQAGGFASQAAAQAACARLAAGGFACIAARN